MTVHGPGEYVSFVKRLTLTHFLPPRFTSVRLSGLHRPYQLDEQIDGEEEISDSFLSFIVHFIGNDSSVCTAVNTGKRLSLTNICFQKGCPRERHLMIPHLFYWRDLCTLQSAIGAL